MKKSPTKRAATPGEEIALGLGEAIVWAKGDEVQVRITRMELPVVDVRVVRRKLRLSQAQFASRFGFAAASVKNWEQGRTRPEGPARVLLALIAEHPEAVDDALRPAV